MSELNLDELTRQIAAGYGISRSHQEALIAAALERDNAVILKDSALDSAADLLSHVQTAARRLDPNHDFLHPYEITMLAEHAVSDLTTLRAQLEEAIGELKPFAQGQDTKFWATVCAKLAMNDGVELARTIVIKRDRARAVLAKLQASGETI